MIPASLLRSSTFRLAMLFLCVFGASALLLLYFIYWTTAGFMERQTVATITAEIQGLRDRYELLGLAGLIQVINERISDKENRDSLYLLAKPDYSPLAGNLDQWPEVELSESGWLTFTLAAPRRRQEMAMARHFLLTGNFHLLVGRNISEKTDIQRRIIKSLFYGLALAVVLGLAGGVFMSRKMLRRLDVINKTSLEIMAGNFSRRIPVKGTGDEFDQLIANLNEMLDQNERLMGGVRQVSDNIAHDLRSPLTRMRNRLELALMETSNLTLCQEALARTVEETDEIIQTFNALLQIAQAESGAKRGDMTRLDLTAIARDIGELYEPSAEEKDLAMTMELDHGATVMGNRHLLSQAMANLLDNAIKYTPAGGRVLLRIRNTPQGPECTVADTGPGIPPEARDKVLERFFRLESSRSAPGSGLGLSLVAAVARLHRAGLSLASHQPDDPQRPGLEAVIRFPRLAELKKGREQA
ncbi:putative two-component sensor histidine kinase [Megalodesulfovibrio gigas DSM 1382 = ATCC 19364]|uniref:histidine kinase n=1 Tax=Megalodesulfovibrio gigas (strain ATCC 19364 / DSM 1382 / NCIMB 9332 / VKM B-1759) TaxID=1121448 RepID=T2GD28_MEGG1|nr:putative two-component sensor histidine kinase [Megalodesulfovibrio gigas DSM 1382 = ATCC 19364]